MDNRKTDFIIQAALLDKFIQLEDFSKDPEGVAVVIRKIKESPDLRRYFFGQNPSYAWANLFYENNFFHNPPNVVEVNNGFQTPYWDMSAYLNSVAENVPQIVEIVVSEIKTNNPVIQEDLINALSKLPPSRSVVFNIKIKSWLEGKYIYFWGFAESAIKLILSWHENGYINEAIELLFTLLKPNSDNVKYSNNYYGGEAKPRVDLDHIQPDFWMEVIPRIGKLAYFETLNLLENLLLECIKVEMLAKNQKVDFTKGMSYFWRTTIADHEQNLNTKYKDRVLVAFRNHLDRGVKKNITQVRQELIRYIEGDNVILKRIAIYIIANNAVSFADLAEKLLEDETVYSDLAFHNDYFQLLSLAYKYLNPNKQGEIVKAIRNGPPPERTKSSKKFALESGFEVEKYLTDRKNFWIRDRLWMIKQYLSLEDKSLLEQLCETYGKPDHPGFLSWSSGGFWVKDVSPQPKEHLETLTPSELLEFVRSWRPNSDNYFGAERISIRGLGEAVAQIILDAPEKYKYFFENMDKVSPSIASCVFSLAKKNSKEKKPLPWDYLIPVIGFFSESSLMLRQETSENNIEVSLDSRLEGIRLLQHGITLNEDHNQILIPENLFQDVKEIIQVYLYDSHPNAEQDRPLENMMGHRDPLTTSLNSVRPIAFMCFMELIKNTNVDKDWAKEHLRRKLDKDFDPSLAVHSIFGRYYWLLAQWNNEWLQDVISKIFPLDNTSESIDYFIAAWDSYIIFNKPGNKTINLLYEEYLYSINLLSEGKTSKTHLDIPGIAFMHIFLDYLWNPYKVHEKDKLLNVFMTKSDDTVRNQAIHALVELVRNSSKGDIAEIWPKIRDFWLWRVNEFSLSQYPSEMEKEIERFSLLATYIPLEEKIEDIQPLLSPFFHNLKDNFVWHNLEKILSLRVEKEPVWVARMYKLMHEKILDTEMVGLRYILYAEEADKIIHTAIKNNESRRDVMKTIDLIFRKNNNRYRQLYEEYS